MSSGEQFDNMDKTTKILCIVAALIAVLLCAASGVIGFRMGKKGIIVERDTVTSVITVRDTVTQYKPQYITKTEIRKELVYLKDTVRVHDSLYFRWGRRYTRTATIGR